MQAAPPVQIACNTGFAWRALHVVLDALAAAVFVSWCAPWIEAAPALAALAAAVAAGAAAWRWPALAAALLIWDGSRWTLDGQAGRTDVMIDLGGWILLRFRPEGRRAAGWLAVSPAAAGVQAHLWRAALYAPPATAALPR